MSSKQVWRSLGNGYRVRLQWSPYELTDADKEQMRELFLSVMRPLAFQAAPGFIENLFNTSILARVFDATGQLAAFGNIKVRQSSGVDVRHIYAVYVSPEHRGRNLSVRAIEAALLEEALGNALCLRQPLYVTGSAVNPMVVRSLGRRCDVWPDLIGEREPPPAVLDIARDSARYYPVRGERDFQVAITPEFAVLDDDGVTQRSGDATFDRRFFEIARPDELKLMLFVSRIRFRHVLQSALRTLQSNLEAAVKTRYQPRTAPQA